MAYLRLCRPNHHFRSPATAAPIPSEGRLRLPPHPSQSTAFLEWDEEGLVLTATTSDVSVNGAAVEKGGQVRVVGGAILDVDHYRAEVVLDDEDIFTRATIVDDWAILGVRSLSPGRHPAVLLSDCQQRGTLLMLNSRQDDGQHRANALALRHQILTGDLAPAWALSLYERDVAPATSALSRTIKPLGGGVLVEEVSGVTWSRLMLRSKEEGRDVGVAVRRRVGRDILRALIWSAHPPAVTEHSIVITWDGGVRCDAVQAEVPSAFLRPDETGRFTLAAPPSSAHGEVRNQPWFGALFGGEAIRAASVKAAGSRQLAQLVRGIFPEEWAQEVERREQLAVLDSTYWMRVGTPLRR